MESVIDDWVLMGFLVGNDFIPHLPHVHIHEDALPALYSTYVQVLPQLDGSILIFIAFIVEIMEEGLHAELWNISFCF